MSAFKYMHSHLLQVTAKLPANHFPTVSHDRENYRESGLTMTDAQLDRTLDSIPTAYSDYQTDLDVQRWLDDGGNFHE